MPKTKPPIFTSHELTSVCKGAIPKHIAFIPDGNRRWALQNQVSIQKGHETGGDSLIEIVKAATELDIDAVTFFLFSTENWARPSLEISALMHLLNSFLLEQKATMLEYGIKLHTIGTLSKLPTYVQETISNTKMATVNCRAIDMVLAINYGARDELCRAIRTLATKCQTGELTPEAITESVFSDHLDTATWNDPQLLIRTSGEMRLSNYLLWQLSYSEIYVTNILWPDFRPKHFLEAILNYQTRHRRLGN